MLNLNKHATKHKPKPTLIVKNCSCVYVSLSTRVVHNTAQNSSDKFPSYPLVQIIIIAQMISTGWEGASTHYLLKSWLCNI